MGSSKEYQRLFDYFAIIGLNSDGGLLANSIQGCSEVLSPLERSYLPTVLGHYPDTVPGQPALDHQALQMLCMPKGLQIRTQKQSLDPIYHPFLITREDGSRCYGFSFTFYEEVTWQHICTALHNLQSTYLSEVAALSTSAPDDSRGTTRSLPREFKWNASRSTFYDITKDQLFVGKSIVLVGRYPEVHTAHKFLTGLYRLFSGCEGGSLESHVYNLLYEVHCPSPGRCISFQCISSSHFCYSPSRFELPLFLYPLKELFTILSPEFVVSLLSSAMMENQVLLVSSDYYRLMLVAESLNALLFPFTWSHVYVPILPSALSHFLDAPVPFIMGLQASNQDKKSINIPDEANLCLVDVDSGVVEVPEDLPLFPQFKEFVEELNKLLASWNLNTKVRSANAKAFGNLSNQFSSPKKDGYDRESLKRSLLSNGIKNLSDGVSSDSTELKALLELLLFNAAVREIFLNRLVHMFSSYDHFLIQPNVEDVDMEKWLNFRESVQNFDKATFLSDQPVAHLPFLSRFIESQMFTSFIDNKILSFWGEENSNQTIFDLRIKELRENTDESVLKAFTYEPCSSLETSYSNIRERLSKVDYVIPPPVAMKQQACTLFNPTHFPLLDKATLNKQPTRSKKSEGSRRRRERQFQHLQHTQLSSLQKDKVLSEAKTMQLNSQPKLSDIAPARIAHTNWKFVEQLLKECKSRTKRMLVDKMGSEAVELGHQEVSLVGVEENTLVASLCHLLERVWAHGLQTKQGKSALWSHLLSYQEVQYNAMPSHPHAFTPVGVVSEKVNSPLSLYTNILTPAANFLFTKIENLNNIPEVSHKTPESAPVSPTHSPSAYSNSRGNKYSAASVNSLLHTRGSSHHGSAVSLNRGSQDSLLPNLPASIVEDMNSVMGMAEIRTEIGYARAWLRLSLEKKVLSKHLSTLLSDSDLVRNLYKRYAFLRSEDEKEQFLSYLLSLNAVDYYCFTNTYTSTKMTYRVVIHTSRKLSAATTTANAWVSLSGSLGQTNQIALNRTNHNTITFQHKNLGLLSTLRLGHDNQGLSPKWLVEYIIVRNEITGHSFRFMCGRWLGKGIDDGSLERILVAEMLPSSISSDDLIESSGTSPRTHSPSISRRTEMRLNVGEIQQLLGDAVNSLVKFFYKPERDRGSLTVLLCGDLGLVPCLELVFSYGFKSSRFFGKNLYLWDYLERIESEFESAIREEKSRQKVTGLRTLQGTVNAVMSKTCGLVRTINYKTTQLGKDDKFQLFVCIAAREHLLHRLLLPLTKCTSTTQLYEESSFLRDPELLRDLINVLATINEFEIVLEDSLTRGIEMTA